MANERARWAEDRIGTWALETEDDRIGISPGSDGVTVELGDAEQCIVVGLSFDQWRAMCALPVVPAETPAIADGTSQPWTPPAEMWTRDRLAALLPLRENWEEVKRRLVGEGLTSDRAHTAAINYLNQNGADPRTWPGTVLSVAELDAVLVVLNGARPAPPADATADQRLEGTLERLDRLKRERDEARKVAAEALTRATAAEAEAGRLTRERDEAAAGAHAQKWTADRVENDLRTELADYRVALRDSGLWPAGEAHDVTPDRIGPRLAALRADRRFELVKAAMAGGRDGYTAVRDADEALGAMGGTKGGGS